MAAPQEYPMNRLAIKLFFSDKRVRAGLVAVAVGLAVFFDLPFGVDDVLDFLNNLTTGE